ncbi:MAG: RNA polymerase Rpb4 family protein [Candidatus Micrarchaeota archaeon]
MQAVSEKPVTLAEVTELLKKRQKEQREGAPLAYEQQNTLDYAEKFAHLSTKDAAALHKKLEALGGLNEKQMVKLIDLLPVKEEDAKSALFQAGFSLEAEQLKQIVALCKEYR